METGVPAVDASLEKGKARFDKILFILETSLIWAVWMSLALFPEAGTRWAGQHTIRRCLQLNKLFGDVPHETVVSVARGRTLLCDAPELFALYKGESAITWDEIQFYAFAMQRQTRYGAQALLGFIALCLLLLAGLHWLLLFLLAGALGLVGLVLLVWGGIAVK